MDLFKYEVTKQKILNFKFIKDIEQFIREQYYVLNRADIFTDSKSYILDYKLYVLALNIFDDKSRKTLPDMFYNLRLNAQAIIIVDLLCKPEYSKGITALDIIDMFEFDKIVLLPKSYDTNLHFAQSLHKLIGSTKLHFKFDWSNDHIAYSSFDSLSVSGDDVIKAYIRVVRFKQTLSPNEPSTVIDSYLAYTKSKLNTISEFEHTHLSDSAVLLSQQLAAVTAVIEEFYNVQS